MALSGSNFIIDLFIGDSTENWGRLVSRFEWKSMVNGGFIVKVRLEDPYFQMLDTIIEDTGLSLLAKGRQYISPMLIRFKLKWNNGTESKERVALVSSTDAVGRAGAGGSFEFIAVDIISYYINAGDCSGKAYKGKIGGEKGVIMQVLNDYLPDKVGQYNILKSVDETDDQENYYWMMRQDPKTFIASLLDWSSSFTKKQTHWVVTSGEGGDDQKAVKIEVRESWNANLEYPSKLPFEGSDGPFVLSYGEGPTPVADIIKWELLLDNFMSAFNTRVATSGISMTTGEYMDRITDKSTALKEKHLFVLDDNTSNKLRAKISAKEGFTKPVLDGGAPVSRTEKGWTHITAIPEIYSGGDIGYKYIRYIDGRARQMYISMLNMLMRLKITIRGEPRLYDSTELGRTKATLRWYKVGDNGPEPRFLDGDWLIYGWHHRLFGGKWETDLYLSRLDFDSLGTPNG